jgi:hypothetical protein
MFCLISSSDQRRRHPAIVIAKALVFRLFALSLHRDDAHWSSAILAQQCNLNCSNWLKTVVVSVKEKAQLHVSGMDQEGEHP